MKLAHRSGYCLTCHEGGHRAHLRYGNCRFAPDPSSKPPGLIAQQPLDDSGQDGGGTRMAFGHSGASPEGQPSAASSAQPDNAGDEQTRTVGVLPGSRGAGVAPSHAGSPARRQTPGQQFTISDSPRSDREIIDALASDLDTQLVSSPVAAPGNEVPAAPHIPGSFQSLADDLSSHHSPPTNPPEDLIKAWQQVMVKLESLHQDVLHYMQRTSDTESHVTALFAELAETRDQVAGIDGRLAALEAQAQAWQDSHQDQQDWWAEHEQGHAERTDPPQHASPHFQIGSEGTRTPRASSEGNRTPRANGGEGIDQQPMYGQPETAAIRVEQLHPLHIPVSQSGTAPAGGTSGLNSGGLAVGLDSPGSAGVNTGLVPSGSIDLRRQLDANLAASFLPSFLRSGLHSAVVGATGPISHETGAGTDHFRPGTPYSTAPMQSGMMPVAGIQSPPPSFGWPHPGISHTSRARLRDTYRDWGHHRELRVTAHLVTLQHSRDHHPSKTRSSLFRPIPYRARVTSRRNCLHPR